ncbi:MAG: FKBP-type peptidyl-prolyl cis-trans isomerase [Thermoplasmata archaeon]|jgi:FKBP-type peptidyl-prolyl cis-trans isomerase 2|nr:FKBP-type peptidyl-prolyl cis-trans isomerase [Thermoplasmata archaeon]MVT12762.1 peptidylprolyl isomerase [Euryarchaeota archaeon]
MKSWTYAILISIIIIGATIGVYYGYGVLSSTSHVNYVKNGDTVSVYYYGYVVINGTRYVFDTNIKAVANDNFTYPKLSIFKYPSSFSPFNFTVGSNQVIEGFSLGVIGMYPGETKTIIVPPSLGYQFNQSLLHNISRSNTISRVQYLTMQEFENRTGEVPYQGMVCKDRVYGWNDEVIFVDSTQNNVTIQNDAYTNSTYYPYGENVDYYYYVNYSNSNYINYVIETTPGTILPNGSSVYYVGPDYLIINSNNYLAGKTLYFVVTLVSIIK